MSAAKNTYTTEITAVVLRLADQLNTDYKCLPDDFTGASKTCFLKIYSKFHFSHDYKLPRRGHDRLCIGSHFRRLYTLSSNSQNLQNRQSSSMACTTFAILALAQTYQVPSSTTTRRSSHTTLSSIFSALFASETHRVFKDVVGVTCAFVPGHIASRFLFLVQPRRISEPILPIAAEAVIWRSTFGHSIIGQSYLHTTTHQPTSTKEETRDVRNALFVPPSATASTESGVLFRILRTQFASYLADMISTMLPRLSSGDESQRDQQPSPEDNSKKRKFWFPQVASMKRRKVGDGACGVALVVEEELAAPKERDEPSESSGARAAQGMAVQRPVVKLRKTRYHTCPWFW